MGVFILLQYAVAQVRRAKRAVLILSRRPRKGRANYARNGSLRCYRTAVDMCAIDRGPSPAHGAGEGPRSSKSQNMERSISYSGTYIDRILGSQHTHRRYLSIAVPAHPCPPAAAP